MSTRIGPPSSWKTPIESPRESIAKTSSSSSGERRRGRARAESAPRRGRTCARAPRGCAARGSRSSRGPSASTPCISYWVTTGASSMRPWPSGLRWIGRYSVSGSFVITTAAAWMPSWRRSPSSPRATSTVRRTAASSSHIRRSSPGGRVAVLVLGVLLEARRERGVAPHHERRHGLGDPVAHREVVAEDARGVAHRGARLDRRERDDLGHVVRARSARRRTGSPGRGTARRSRGRCRASPCGPGSRTARTRGRSAMGRGRRC